jgi:four helix bundle protein
MGTLDDLVVYQKAVELRRKIKPFADSFPPEEKFSLKSQLKRSSRSISANIAEGYGRYHYQENIQFLRISRGSLLETIDHISVAFDEEYIDELTKMNLTSDCHLLLKILNGYIAYLKRKKNPPDEAE